MHRTLYFSFLAIGAISVAACSSEPAADTAVTETRMNAVDAAQGTISDEMIVTDDMSEQAPIADASEAPAEPVKTIGKPEKKQAAKPKPADAPKSVEAAKPAPKPPVDKASAE